MQFSRYRRFFTSFLAVLHLLVSIASIAPHTAYAQVVDTVPPVINLEPVDNGFLGQNQIFTAMVTDDQTINSVILYYRLTGSAEYRTLEMQAPSGGDVYTATVEASTLDESISSIQYYIEAKDVAGNRTLQGFAFNPLERVLSIQEPPLNANAQDDSSLLSGLSIGQKVLIGLLGVVVVGALVASSSSSSGGGGSSEPGVDVTIIVDPIPAN